MGKSNNSTNPTTELVYSGVKKFHQNIFFCNSTYLSRTIVSLSCSKKEKSPIYNVLKNENTLNDKSTKPTKLFQILPCIITVAY